MVDRDLLAAKLAELADRTARVRAKARSTAEALAADRDAFDLVAFHLMLAVQSAADIASHLIADEGWAPAPTLAEAFLRLAERGVVDAPTAAALGRAVGLRNAVAHGYARIDAAAVHTASTSGLDDLERFARQVSAWSLAGATPR